MFFRGATERINLVRHGDPPVSDPASHIAPRDEAIVPPPRSRGSLFPFVDGPRIWHAVFPGRNGHRNFRRTQEVGGLMSADIPGGSPTSPPDLLSHSHPRHDDGTMNALVRPSASREGRAGLCPVTVSPRGTYASKQTKRRRAPAS
jgi:hypothetical protein